MTTITIVTACWGEEYAQFIPRWWSGLQGLNRKPDEIILGIAPGDPTGLSKSVPDGISVKIVELPEGSASEKWDYAIRQASSKWWCYMAIDDELCPDAFDEIDQADEQGAELLVDSIIVRHNRHHAKGHWDTTHIAELLPVPGWMPTTVDLYKRIGVKHEYKFVDWIFQIDAAKAGVKVFHANTTRMIWDAGLDRPTISSDLNAYKPEETRKVFEYAKANGF